MTVIELWEASSDNGYQDRDKPTAVRNANIVAARGSAEATLALQSLLA